MRRIALLVTACLAAAVLAAPLLSDESLVPEDRWVRAARLWEESVVPLRVHRGASRDSNAGIDVAYRALTLYAGRRNRETASALVGGGGQATGVRVGDGGSILTSFDAVHGATKVEALVGGAWVETAPAGSDRDFGVAVLRIGATGTAVALDPIDLVPGQVLLVPSAVEGAGLDAAIVASRAPASSGGGFARLPRALPNSALGAPVLGPDGRARGMVVATQGAPTPESCTACHTTQALARGAPDLTDLGSKLDRSWHLAWLARGSTAQMPRFQYVDPHHGGVQQAPAVAHVAPGRRIARALDDLLRDGRVHKAYLGLVLGSAGDPRAIAQVLAGSPGEGRLQSGDRLVAIGSRRLGPQDDVTLELLSLHPGAPATLTVLRGTEEVTVRVTPTERVGDASARGAPAFGFEVVPLTDELRTWLGVKGEGVVVSSVVANGAADRAGLKRGQRVVRFADHTVQSLADVDAASDDGLRRLAAGEPVEVVVVDEEGNESTVRLLGK